MVLGFEQKESLKKSLISCLAKESEVRRIVVFGSFLKSSDPDDMDVAVFQDSDESYLSLALKYRRRVRPVSSVIPLDIIPMRDTVLDDPFLKEVAAGEIIYER